MPRRNNSRSRLQVEEDSNFSPLNEMDGDDLDDGFLPPSRLRTRSMPRLDEGLVLPFEAKRRCTDVTWAVLFLFFAVLSHGRIIWVIIGKIESWERLIGFRDFEGDLCVPDTNNQTDNKYLYFCMTELHHLNVTAPICLSDCPTTNNTIVPGCTLKLQGYSTYDYWDQVCRPVYESGLEVEILPWLWAARTRSLFRIVTVNHWLFEAILVLTVVLSYFSYWFLYINGRLLVKAGMFMATTVPLVYGLWAGGILSKIPGAPARPDGVFSGYVIAALMAVVSMTFGGVMCSRRHLIDRVVDCLEMAFVCICQSRLLLHPLVVVVFYALCGFCISLALALWTASVRRDELSLQQVSLFWSLILVWAWTSQIVFTASELTLNLIVLTWCVKGGLSQGKATLTNGELCRAYWIPLRYHFGTCVLGGLVIGIVRPFDLTIGKAFRFLRSKYNMFGGVVEYLAGDIMDAYKTNIGLLKKHAFLEVAMKGRAFNEAAQRAYEVEESQSDIMRILNGATWIIQFCCIVINAGMGCWLATFAMCMTTEKGDIQDARERAAIVVVSCLVAIVVTLPFVLMFDTVSDALLFAHDVEEQFNRREKANSLRQQKLCTVCMGRQTIAEFFQSWGIVWPGYRLHKNLPEADDYHEDEDEDEEAYDDFEDDNGSQVDDHETDFEEYDVGRGGVRGGRGGGLGVSTRSLEEGKTMKGWR